MRSLYLTELKPWQIYISLEQRHVGSANSMVPIIYYEKTHRLYAKMVYTLNNQYTLFPYSYKTRKFYINIEQLQCLDILYYLLL